MVFLLSVVGVFGLCFGSFLNVVIYRLPRNESIVFPGSHCPHCNANIAWYDNIPVLSWLLLGGKCRSCKEKISGRYPLVEIITALLLVAIVWKYGATSQSLVYIVLTLFLVPISFIDIDTKLILNKLTFPCFIVGIILVPLFHIVSWRSMLVGGLGSGLILWLIGVIGTLIFKKESLGFGDVKLIVIIGVYLGFPSVLIAFYFGVLIAGVYILSALIGKRLHLGDILPFGPFIAIGTIVYLILGDLIIDWYLLKIS